MWWYGRGNSGGSWLPEEKKANMWPGRGNSGGSWPPAFLRSTETCFLGAEVEIGFFFSRSNDEFLEDLQIEIFQLVISQCRIFCAFIYTQK